MGGAGRSFQDAVRRRQQAGFVARTTELAQFRANLALPTDSADRQFVFSVHGDGGVGKSFLLSRWAAIAQGDGALTCRVDEPVFGVPDLCTLRILPAAGAAFTLIPGVRRRLGSLVLRGFRAKVQARLTLIITV